MNRKEFISAVAKKTMTEARVSQPFVEAVLETIIESCKNNDPVAVVGFGSFSVVSKKEREGINPKTGEKIMIPAKKTVKFKPGKDFLEKL